MTAYAFTRCHFVLLFQPISVLYFIDNGDFCCNCSSIFIFERLYEMFDQQIGFAIKGSRCILSANMTYCFAL